MAYGLPVVGSNGGGVPEMIVEGETGLLVPMGDADGLARALVALLADPAKSLRMGRAGNARVRQQFTTARVAGQVEEVYKNVLAATKTRSST
jgi:glycosyltransferase involved in cell wall biosynthesis